MLCSESAEESSSKGDKIPSPSLQISFKSQHLEKRNEKGCFVRSRLFLNLYLTERFSRFNENWLTGMKQKY